MKALVERGYDPLAYRYLCLTAHYRSILNFSWDSLDGAATALDRLRRLIVDWVPAQASDDDYVSRFRDCINDDLNTARAVALTWELVRSDLPQDIKKSTLIRFDRVLGLQLNEWQPEEALIPENVRALSEQRESARTAKRWKEADRLRDEIQALGFEIEDTAKGPQLIPKDRV